MRFVPAPHRRDGTGWHAGVVVVVVVQQLATLWGPQRRELAELLCREGLSSLPPLPRTLAKLPSPPTHLNMLSLSQDTDRIIRSTRSLICFRVYSPSTLTPQAYHSHLPACLLTPHLVLPPPIRVFRARRSSNAAGGSHAARCSSTAAA